MISTKVHGVLDYSMALILILLPFLLGFPSGNVANVPVALGLLTIAYSALTKYEMGPFKVIPMKLHLGLDFMSGVLLVVSPWLFGFAEIIIWPFVVLGIIEVGAALLTEKKSPLVARKNSREIR